MYKKSTTKSHIAKDEEEEQRRAKNKKIKNKKNKNKNKNEAKKWSSNLKQWTAALLLRLQLR